MRHSLSPSFEGGRQSPAGIDGSCPRPCRDRRFAPRSCRRRGRSRHPPHRCSHPPSRTRPRWRRRLLQSLVRRDRGAPRHRRRDADPGRGVSRRGNRRRRYCGSRRPDCVRRRPGRGQFGDHLRIRLRPGLGGKAPAGPDRDESVNRCDEHRNRGVVRCWNRRYAARVPGRLSHDRPVS